MQIKVFLIGIGLLALSKLVPPLFPFGLATILSSFDAKISSNSWHARYHP